ncbi:hypothetical protein JR316_0000505 [Psilocybe cubensis]|uniref:Uncharacterized protein n=2 Tax=Psilocybe cubensis TaxID=181762 RepID=A0A8H7Y6Y9_PSICU|nr:hypothetical protein JR316_0000505 [Psilocybe cubensis]KAH9486440.1 hypothetical protein JR316_0000505 [Psilocybe cubensis]
MSSSFRASPWVTYEPTTTSFSNRQQVSESEMDDDIDMEAPQISTLREEETPPPQPPKKLVINPRKRPAATPASTEPWSGTKKKKESNEEEEDEELIDELIDDDDDELAKPSPSSQPGRSTESTSKRKLSVKKKARKSDKKTTEGEKKVKEKGSQPTGAHNLAPTMSCFKANLAESHEDIEIVNSSPTNHPGGESSVPKAKKKASPRKPPTVPRPKAKVAKQKSAIPPLLIEDTAVLSESYAGTAASSPVTAQFEQNSPEPENIAPSSPNAASAPLIEEPNLENVPIPVYPLPTKPFPVQPPQKIVTGFAPLIPLDRSNKKVRHWREANREIRGIAGGHWVTRSWVGCKESEYSAHVAATNQAKIGGDEKANTVAIPKLSSVSISAPVPGKALNKLKVSSKSGSTVTSANASRATSVVPEPQSIPITSTVRAPTKMRILQLAPSSEGGDSDLAPAHDT